MLLKLIHSLDKIAEPVSFGVSAEVQMSSEKSAAECHAQRGFETRFRVINTSLLVSIFALLVLVMAPCGFAQGTTSVLGGKVFDSASGVIPGAVVTVISDETGVQTTAKTNSAGNWQVDALVTGHYHFTVQASGFETLQHSSIELEISDQKYVDVTLAVGKITDTVNVVSETPLIDTTASVSGTTLSNKDFEELPSQSGSPMEFVRYAPGVFLSAPSGGAALLFSTNSLSSIVTNGSGSGNNAMNYMMDGGTNTIVSNGQEAFIPPNDAVGEMKVMTNAYDAAVERTAAGTINMTIKNGGKDFHGSLYERNINNFLNANYYQNNATGVHTPTVHLNEWGGSVGGPVWLPKLWNGRKRGTFFFFSYDGIRNTSPSATGFASVPTQAERNGDFSASRVSNSGKFYPVTIYDPNTATPAGSRTAFANAMINPTRFSPIAKAILSLVPLPNNPQAPQDGTDSNNYVLTDPKIDKFSSYIGRVDQTWNNNHHSYFEYRFNQLDELAGDPYGPTNILVGAYLLRHNYGGTVNHSWVLSSNLLATLIGNVTIYTTSTFSPANAPGVKASSYGFSSQFEGEQLNNGLPAITNLFQTPLGNTSGPSYENDYNYEGRASIQQIHKNHTLHYGVGYLAQQEANGSQSGAPGTYNFSNIWTNSNPNTVSTAAPGEGSALASFLLGLPSSGSMTSNAAGYYSQPYIGTYIQDEWRIRPKLTISMGLRWDYQFPMTERHDKYWTRFDPNYNLSAITNYAQPKYAAEITGTSTNTGVQMLQQQRSDPSSFVARGAILYAGQNGVSRSMTDPQYKYFQPRVGMAYQITPTLVFRAGFGRFVQSNYVANHANQQGYSATTTFVTTTNNYISPSSTLDNPYPAGLTPITGNSQGVYTAPGSVSSFYTSDIKRQYTDDYSAHIQYQVKDYLFEVGGVYEYTYGLVVGYHVNNPTVSQYHAEYDPQFDSTGRPVATLPGDTQVTNPFKGSPYITNSLETSSTVAASSLLRPNPLLGDLVENFYNGTSQHYALQSKAQKRMRKGFAATVSFSWGKQMDTTGFVTNNIISQTLLRQLSSSDRRFQLTGGSSYTLPFGRGKWIGANSSRLVDAFIGGWEVSANYTFYSGVPISLPTNSAFFEGGDPGLGSAKSNKKWFDTSKFVAYPTISTTADDLHNPAKYPAWTGVSALPGYNWVPAAVTTNGPNNGVYHDFVTRSTNYPTQYGDVRNPYTNKWDLGIRKSFQLTHGVVAQLKMDAFNALNHPTFGNIGTTVSGQYFGVVNNAATLSQVNDPRNVQLSGRITF